jgi:hypothetical protein
MSYYPGHFGLKDIKHIAKETANTASRELAPHVQDLAFEAAAKAQRLADGAARIAEEVRANADQASSYYGHYCETGVNEALLRGLEASQRSSIEDFDCGQLEAYSACRSNLKTVTRNGPQVNHAACWAAVAAQYATRSPPQAPAPESRRRGSSRWRPQFNEAYERVMPDRCSDRNALECGSDGRCEVHNNTCRKKYCEHRTEAECLTRDGCGWTDRLGCGERVVNNNGTVDIFYDATA